jgi:protocatechuate 3,4-dioxygenase beta subunit
VSLPQSPRNCRPPAAKQDARPCDRLVIEINNKIVVANGAQPTSSTILGPFWSPETPFRENGDSVVQNMPPDGQLTFFHGIIKDAETGKGIPNAIFDMWQASTNGKYDIFDPENRTYLLSQLAHFVYTYATHYIIWHNSLAGNKHD